MSLVENAVLSFSVTLCTRCLGTRGMLIAGKARSGANVPQKNHARARERTWSTLAPPTDDFHVDSAQTPAKSSESLVD